VVSVRGSLVGWLLVGAFCPFIYLFIFAI